MNRERMSQNFGENSNSSENGRPFDRKIGREMIGRLGGETVGNETAGDTLEGVTAAMQRLGSDAANRTSENFSKLVKAADLPFDTKEQLISEYQDGDDFEALINALGTQAGEVKATRREQLIGKLKSKIGRGVAIGAATLMLVGVGFAMHFNNANAQDVPTESPVKIMEEVAAEDDGDVEELSDDEEIEEETSILDDETLYKELNYDNLDLDAIGDAFVERFIDTGEGYEVSENGVMANFSDYNDFANKTSKVACNTPVSKEALAALENGDRSLYINEVMTKLGNNPANAASHLALIDPAMDAIGVPDEIQDIEKYNERAQAIWNWVREQGGQANKEMLAALFAAYNAETTEFEVITRTGDDWTMYETVEDASKPISIENAVLRGQARIERDEAVQVVTRMHFVDKDNNEVTVEYTTNAMCVQITGQVVITIKNPITQEETKIIIELDDESTDNTVSESKGGGSTGGGGGKKESEEKDDENDDDGGEEEITGDIVKGKDAASLQEGVNQNLADAGSVNVIDQTANLDESGSTGTMVNLDSEGKVAAVINDDTGDTVVVVSGDTTPTYEETYKAPEEVKAAVNEGKSYTNDAEKQTANENDEADALMSLLGGN